MQRLAVLAVASLCLVTPAAAATLSVEIDGQKYTGHPVSAKLEEVVTVAVIVTGGKAAPPVQLPHVGGLDQTGAGTNPFGGRDEYTFFMSSNRPGLYTIPSFNVRTTTGQMLPVPPISLSFGR